MTTEGHLATLAQWSEWGKASFPTRVSRPDWSAVNALIEAAKPRLLQDSSVLRELLAHSADQLKLPDPLLCDFGVHRWLDRETSYSDWLAWVLERLGDAGAVLRVLGVQNPQFVPLRVGNYVVQRELQVEKSLSGCKGQIDLLIRFGECALLGVEVKTEDEQYEKQRGYKESLLKLGLPAECVLVANRKVPSNKLYGFKLRPWKEISLALRRAVADYVRSHGGDEERIIAAMMLGFVAAIEQNLLGFGTAAPRRARKGEPTLLPKELHEYLKAIVR